MSYKGNFRPNNPSKYLGDPTNIIYRSLWELKLMIYLDKHPDILGWVSEGVVIPYRSPLDRRIHRYFVDFYVKRRVNGKIKETLIEVKPEIQTKPPKIRQRPSRKYIKEVATYGINEAKWKAAQAYCEDRGWDFKIMTEKELNVN